MEALRAEIAALKSAVSEKSATIEAKTSRIEELEAENRDLNEELDKVRGEVSTINNKVRGEVSTINSIQYLNGNLVTMVSYRLAKK